MKHILLIGLIVLCTPLLGQNLIPNASFEDANICSEIKIPCSPSGWFYINHKPIGYYGRSKLSSADGDKHLSLLVIDTSTGNRDYWQTRLLCTLIKDETYRISIKIASESKSFNVRDIGFHFSNAFLQSTEDTVLQREEYLSFIGATIRKSRKGWYEVETDFTPTQNFTHLTIGNFSMKTNRQLTVENKLASRWSVIAIDDISITPKNQIRCEDMSAVRDSLYGIRSRHSIVGKPTKKHAQEIIVIENIEFDFDSAVIRNEDTLQYLKPYLKDTTIKLLRVLGYTDISGTPSYNDSLSLRRASSVSKYLKEKLNINVPIETEGRGISYSYIEPQRNRRVEIWIYR